MKIFADRTQPIEDTEIKQFVKNSGGKMLNLFVWNFDISLCLLEEVSNFHDLRA